MVQPMKTVGLVFKRRKLERSGFLGLEDYANKRNIRIVYIDLSLPIEEQAPLDLIVHKMTDIVSKMERGDLEAKKMYQRFITYVNEHPNVLILDEWKNIEKVLDRAVLYRHTQVCANKGVSKDGKSLFYVPKSISLESTIKLDLQYIDIQFPVLCKRRTACSSKEAHEMVLVPNAHGMMKLSQYFKDDPVILQEFVQHDGVIVKVYVADGHITASTRPSFKNLDPTGDVVYFDSQALPKSFDTTVSLQEDLEKVFLKVDAKGVHIQKEAILNLNVLKDMTHLLQEQLGLTFFGFDVLLESNTNRYYIVDVNYFPSFKNVDGFHSIFMDILETRLLKR